MVLLPGQACRVEALGEAWSPRQIELIVCVCLRFNYLFLITNNGDQQIIPSTLLEMILKL